MAHEPREPREPLLAADHDCDDHDRDDHDDDAHDDRDDHDDHDATPSLPVYADEKPPPSPRRTVWSTAAAVLVALVPLHLRDFAAAAGPRRATSWLDGLRGVASYWVLNTHIGPTLSKAYGAGFGCDGQHYTLLQLPIVRLVYAGHFSVDLFFIISGYALSLSVVSRINHPHAPLDADAALRSLSSSVFRRPTRLLLPAFASTLFALLIIQTGAIVWAARIRSASTVLQGWEDRYTIIPAPMPLLSQLGDLWVEDRNLLRLFARRLNQKTRYNGVLWTIPIELRASLFLYVWHVGMMYLRRRYRLLLTAASVLLAVHLGYDGVDLFLAGYFFCELDAGRRGPQAPTYLATAAWALVALVGLYLGSMSNFRPEHTPGYMTLARLNPLGYYEAAAFWVRTGACLLFYALASCEPLRRPLATPLARYLGRISFSLYLVHLPMVTVLATAVYDALWRRTGLVGAAYWAGTAVSYVCVAYPVFVVADAFCRGVDEPSVALGRRLEKLLSAPRPN